MLACASWRRSQWDEAEYVALPVGNTQTGGDGQRPLAGGIGEQVRSADGLARLASTHSGLTVFEFICNGKAVATHDAQFIAPDPSRDAAEPQEFPDPQRAKSDHRGRKSAPYREQAKGVCARHSDVSAPPTVGPPKLPHLSLIACAIDAHRARRNDE
jgi:hypothetical protein